jgi:hypothetical protein
MTKRIPIKAAKEISDKYNQDQVIIVTWDKTNNQVHVVTYGKTINDCDQAALGGNFVKKALNWPDELCNSEPNRIKKMKEEILALKNEIKQSKELIKCVFPPISDIKEAK